MGHMGLSGEREGQPGWAVRLLPLVRIGLGEGGRRPPFLLPLPFPFPLLVGVLLLLGGGLLLGAPIGAGRPPPLAPLYTGAGGTPRHTS